MTNTHQYDGKLDKIITLIKDDLDRVHKISKNEKLEKFKVLRLVLNEKIKKDNLLVIRFFDLICASIGHSSNYDPSNKIYAEDLLYLCYELWENDKEILEELAIQLVDMNTGSCPQGRTTRLFQIYIAIKDII